MKTCCVVYSNKKTYKKSYCKGAKVEGSNWCEKHKGLMDGVTAQGNRAIESEKNYKPKESE